MENPKTCQIHGIEVEMPHEAAKGLKPVLRPTVSVGFATRGRAEVLRRTVEFLKEQSLQPASIIIVGTSPEDVIGVAAASNVSMITSPPGTAKQRNAVLDRVPEGTDFVVFFDDDFVPHPLWIEAAAEHFARHPDVGAITGNVVADGILGPGITFDAAQEQVLDERKIESWVSDGFSPYGCNMAFRMSAIESLRFDERLVLYGWLEDRDFGAALTKRGWRKVKIGASIGIHMGVKRGRTLGRKLGYSQIINPIYIVRKGNMSLGEALTQMARNLTANLIRSFSAEPYIDRSGRLAGNFIGIIDLCRGRITPERAERI